MRSAVGQTHSAIGQMLARLAKRARNLPNVAHLVKCRAFDQLVKCAAHFAKCADCIKCALQLVSRKSHVSTGRVIATDVQTPLST